MHAPCYDCERFQEKLSEFQDRIKSTHTAEDWAHCCDWLLLTDMASGVEGTSTDVRAKISRSSSSHFWRSLKIKIVQEVRSALQKKKRQTNRYYRKYSTQECIDLDRLTRACWPKSYIHPRRSPFLKYHYSHKSLWIPKQSNRRYHRGGKSASPFKRSVTNHLQKQTAQSPNQNTDQIHVAL